MTLNNDIGNLLKLLTVYFTCGIFCMLHDPEVLYLMKVFFRFSLEDTSQEVLKAYQVCWMLMLGSLIYILHLIKQR